MRKAKNSFVMLPPSFFGSRITIIRSNSPIIPQKGECLAQPCIQVGTGWCGREAQLAKVMCPEQSWDRSPLPGPQQVPVMAPSQQTGFIPPSSAQTCQCGMSVGALEGSQWRFVLHHTQRYGIHSSHKTVSYALLFLILKMLKENAI